MYVAEVVIAKLAELRMSKQDQTSEEKCYEAGYDSVVNGANTENCHFTFFATPTKTAAWERGAAAARDGDRQ